MKVHLIFGGPGTGKTTYLAQLYKDSVEKHGADKVRFVSFTRGQVTRDKFQAAKIMKTRVSNIKGFSTLHSAGMKSYGDVSADIIDRFELHKLSEFLGVDMENVLEGYDFMRSSKNENYAIGANKAGMPTALFTKCVYFYEQVKKLKSEKKATVDFSDMIMNAIATKFTFDCKVAFVDEAQDLSALQWQAVYTLFKNVDDLYVAGDPNQALYRFQGGLPNYMNEMRFDTIKYLDVSHRCSNAVMITANNILRHMKSGNPAPKPSGMTTGFSVFYPKTDLHEKFFKPIQAAITHGKTVLVLAYTYDQLVKVEDALLYPKGREYNPNGGLRKPCGYSFLSGREKKMSRKKSKLTLSTVHQAKGLEADFVFINISSGKGHYARYEYKDFFRHQEDYDKTMYVAVTRAKIGVVFFEMTAHTATEPSLYEQLCFTQIGKDYYNLLVEHRLDKRVAKKLLQTGSTK